MKRRRARMNPNAVATFAWAAASAAVGGLSTYFVLREVYAAQVVDHCAAAALQKQAIAAQTGGGMQGAGAPKLTKEQARAWF